MGLPFLRMNTFLILVLFANLIVLLAYLNETY